MVENFGDVFVLSHHTCEPTSFAFLTLVSSFISNNVVLIDKNDRRRIYIDAVIRVNECTEPIFKAISFVNDIQVSLTPLPQQ